MRVRARRLHDGGGVGEEGRQRAKGNHRRRGASEAPGGDGSGRFVFRSARSASANVLRKKRSRLVLTRTV